MQYGFRNFSELFRQLSNIMKIKGLLFGLALAVGAQSLAQLPTAQEIAKSMYPGWNLGNTLEANNNGTNFTNNVGLSGETAWQSSKTTQEVIDFVKSQGFKSVRIPCSWVCGHVSDSASIAIDAAWMARVKEVVDYCIADGLYVVLNDHYDGGWVESSFSDISDSTVEANSSIMRQVWTQIANEFKDYDEHLLFAGLNEPACDNQAKTDALVKYEQAFIDAVRATGGNNTTRTLIVQGPSTDIDNTSKFYTTLPTDVATDRLMVEVHYYSPAQFCGVWEEPNAYYFWGAANHISSSTLKKYNATDGEEDYVKSQFAKMKAQFVDKGIPVIIGEYGANWRNIGNKAAQKKHDSSVMLYHQTVCQEAISCGMVPFVWDVNVSSQNGTSGIMTVISRGSLSVFCSPAMDGIAAGVKAAQWPGTSALKPAPQANGYTGDGRYYNILGQRIRPDSKGILIRDGRKFIRK